MLKSRQGLLNHNLSPPTSQGKKDQNPVDMVKFYSKYDPHNAFHIPGHQESLLVPREFNELNIRLFSKKSEHIALIQEAFRARLRQLNREKWDQLRSMGGSDHLGIGGGSINNINNDENGGGINKVLMSVKEYRTSGAAFGARDGEAVDMMMGFEEDDDDDSSHHPSFLLSSSSCAASRSSRMGGGGGGGDLSSQQSTSTISLLPTFLDQEMHTDRDRHSFVESVSMGLGTVNSTGVVKNTGSIHLPSSSSTSSSSSSSPVHHRNNSKITTAISSAIGTGTVGGGSGGESVTFVTPFFSRPDANHQDEGMNGTSGTSASTTTAAKRNSSAMSPDAQQRRSGGGGGGEGGTSSVFSTPKLIKTASSSSAKNIQNNNKGDVSSPFRTPAPLSSAVHNNNNNNVIDRRLSSDSNNGGEITIEKDENDKTSSTTPPTAPGGLVQHHHVSLQQFRGSLTPNIGMTLPKDYDQIATSPMKLKRRRTESVEEKRQ